MFLNYINVLHWALYLLVFSVDLKTFSLRGSMVFCAGDERLHLNSCRVTFIVFIPEIFIFWNIIICFSIISIYCIGHFTSLSSLWIWRPFPWKDSWYFVLGMKDCTWIHAGSPLLYSPQNTIGLVRHVVRGFHIADWLCGLRHSHTQNFWLELTTQTGDIKNAFLYVDCACSGGLRCTKGRHCSDQNLSYLGHHVKYWFCMTSIWVSVIEILI